MRVSIRFGWSWGLLAMVWWKGRGGVGVWDRGEEELVVREEHRGEESRGGVGDERVGGADGRSGVDGEGGQCGVFWSFFLY